MGRTARFSCSKWRLSLIHPHNYRQTCSTPLQRFPGLLAENLISAQRSNFHNSLLWERSDPGLASGALPRTSAVSGRHYQAWLVVLFLRGCTPAGTRRRRFHRLLPPFSDQQRAHYPPDIIRVVFKAASRADLASCEICCSAVPTPGLFFFFKMKGALEEGAAGTAAPFPSSPSHWCRPGLILLSVVILSLVVFFFFNCEQQFARRSIQPDVHVLPAPTCTRVLSLYILFPIDLTV